MVHSRWGEWYIKYIDTMSVALSGIVFYDHAVSREIMCDADIKTTMMNSENVHHESHVIMVIRHNWYYVYGGSDVTWISYHEHNISRMIHNGNELSRNSIMICWQLPGDCRCCRVPTMVCHESYTLAPVSRDWHMSIPIDIIDDNDLSRMICGDIGNSLRCNGVECHCSLNTSQYGYCDISRKVIYDKRNRPQERRYMNTAVSQSMRYNGYYWASYRLWSLLFLKKG